MGLSILIVDDKPDMTLALVQWASGKGHEVESALDGDNAIKALQRRQVVGRGYDLIIVDLVMPGMDGLTLARELRMRKSKATLVLITGYAAINPRLPEDARAAGFSTVLDKPIDHARLEAMMGAIAAERSSTQAIAAPDPAFGTSRIVRQNRSTPLGLANSSAAPPSTGTDANDDYAPTADGAPAAGGTGGWRKQPSDPYAPAPASQTGYVKRRSEVFLDTGMQPEPGTARTVDPKTGQIRHGSGLHRIPASAPAQAAQQPPTGGFTAGYRRSVGGTTPPPATAGGSGGTSAIFRRQVAPQAPPPAAGVSGMPAIAPAQPQTTLTMRLRRGLAAQPSADEAQKPREQAYTVACAHCGKGFVVAGRSDAYNAICIHCGGVNRIEPTA